MWQLVEDALGPDAAKWLALVTVVIGLGARVLWMVRRG